MLGAVDMIKAPPASNLSTCIEPPLSSIDSRTYLGSSSWPPLILNQMARSLGPTVTNLPPAATPANLPAGGMIPGARRVCEAAPGALAGCSWPWRAHPREGDSALMPQVAAPDVRRQWEAGGVVSTYPL